MSASPNPKTSCAFMMDKAPLLQDCFVSEGPYNQTNLDQMALRACGSCLTLPFAIAEPLACLGALVQKAFGEAGRK